MAKQIITSEQLAQLAKYQAQIDTVIEYISPECWSLANLRKELKEVKENLAACDQEIDGQAPDGTFDGMDKAQWALYVQIIAYIVDIRKTCKKLTEAQLDQIES